MNRVPGFLLQVNHRHPIRARTRTGVGHKNVDASEFFNRLGHHVIHLPRVGNVRQDTDRFPPHLFNFADDGGRPLPSCAPIRVRITDDVVDDDIGALFRKSYRNCAANSTFTTGACHQCNFTVEIIHSNLPFPLIESARITSHTERR